MLSRTAGVFWHRMHRLDTRLCLSVNHSSCNRQVRLFFCLVSRLGDGVFWYAVMLGILLAQPAGGLAAVVHMAVAGIASTVLYKVIKSYVSRLRPFEANQAIQLTGVPLDRFSFPSGHTLHAVLFGWIALAYYPALAWLLVPFTTLVAVSRVVLGLHYPSDVLAGAAIGALIAEFSLGL